ncbi:hypothetical protein ANN_13832, partial [Periplaneta americana]
MKAELLDAAPNGSLAVCHKSGWIQNERFVQWCHHILSNVKPTKDDAVILVLDGHYSHTRNVELLELSRVNGAHIVCLPPHCTHKMQLLGVAFMLPFKTYYAEAIEQWLKQNAGRVVTHYQVGMLLGEAFNKAATVAVATNSFRNTGLYPCNRHIFSDFEFQEVSPNTHESSDHSSEALPNRLDDANTSQPRPGSIIPTQRKRQKKQSQVSSDSEDEELDEPVYISIDNGDSENYAECPYCNVKFSFDKRGEKWIVCTKCGIWCHDECSGDDDYKNCIVLLFG